MIREKIRPIVGAMGTTLALAGTFACSQTYGEAPALPESETAAENTPDSGSSVSTIEEKKDSPSEEKESPSTKERQRKELAAPRARPKKTMPPEEPCGAHTCFRFGAAREALVPLLLLEKARVVGFGEAHARASSQGPSTVKRFTDDLLPTFSDGVSHLMVEILAPPSQGCEKETAVAKKESKKITQGQAKSNQNEYLAMGGRARDLGIVPDVLRVTCDDLSLIASKEGGVLAYMETIAKVFAKDLINRAGRTKKSRPLVVAYGGAMHNDRMPREHRESWSYAAAVRKATSDSFLEVDLIVPELITDSESWKNMPWYNDYRALNHEEGAVLMRVGEKSYALFFAPHSGPEGLK